MRLACRLRSRCASAPFPLLPSTPTCPPLLEPPHRRHLHATQCRQTPSRDSIPQTKQGIDIRSARAHCIGILRKYDTPSYLLTPYIPRQARDAYIAIRTLNIELARTADTTSNATLASIRFQFHRDAVTSSLQGSPPEQPLSILLSHAANALSHRSPGSKFSKAWFNRLISTRQHHLTNPPFVDMAAMERYAEDTYSTLSYLILQALPANSLTLDHIASHIGKATGIATILRGLPLLAFPNVQPASGRAQAGEFAGESTPNAAVMLPLSIMRTHGVREEDVFRQAATALGLRDAVFEVATRANDHLITARDMVKRIRQGKDSGHDFEHADESEHVMQKTDESGGSSERKDVNEAFGVFMPAVSTALWLDRLQKCDFDVFAPELRKTDWRLPFRAWWAYTTKRF